MPPFSQHQTPLTSSAPSSPIDQPMAGSSLDRTPEAGFFKSVQELAENGEELPERFIWKNTTGDYGPIQLEVPPTEEIPVIDINRLVSSSSSGMDAEVVKLRSALSSWGCFQAINHGVGNTFLDEMRKISVQFFHLLSPERQRYARRGNEMEGYGGDMVLYEDQVLDWTDRLYLTVSPQEQQKLQYWPENPTSFRNMLQEYTARLRKLLEQLLKSIARSLTLPEDCFLNQFGERLEMLARFNYYPPCSRPDLVHGLKPHADGSGLTILLMDKQVEGLQVLKDNQWFRVPVLPEALFVNLGDQLEIMSNGVFKSPVHRVITNSDRERVTLAMFCSPEAGKEIGPEKKLIGDGRPRLYKKSRYYAETYFQYYQQGKRPIDAVRI